MAKATVRDLRKSCGAQPVLLDVDLDMADEDFAKLVSPSKGRKSTLLKTIAGARKCRRGRDPDRRAGINNLAPAERDIEVVFETFGLYPKDTVAANMGFALKRPDDSKAMVAEQVGRPLEPGDRPGNLFAVEFIGAPSITLIPGVIAEGRARAHGHRLAANGGTEGQKVGDGICPEHLEPEAADFAAPLRVIEPTGAGRTVYLVFGGTEIVAVFRNRHDFAPGGTVHLRPMADKVHRFDVASGLRI